MGRLTTKEAAARKAAEAERFKAVMAGRLKGTPKALKKAQRDKAEWWAKVERGQKRAAARRKVEDAERRQAAAAELAQLLRDQGLTDPKAISEAAIRRMRGRYALPRSERPKLNIPPLEPDAWA